jgi:hypothetical protein
MPQERQGLQWSTGPGPWVGGNHLLQDPGKFPRDDQVVAGWSPGGDLARRIPYVQPLELGLSHRASRPPEWRLGWLEILLAGWDRQDRRQQAHRRDPGLANGVGQQRLPQPHPLPLLGNLA